MPLMRSNLSHKNGFGFIEVFGMTTSVIEYL